MKQVNSTVTVKLTGLDGKEVSIERPVSYNEPETADDVLTLLQGSKDDIEYTVGALAYGLNLKARAKVTAQIKNENQGPEVSINRLLAQMEKNHEKAGKPFDKEASRKFILGNLEMFGIGGNSAAA